MVKNALSNINTALQQRSEALSVTSVGHISRKNMKLLTMGEENTSSLDENKEQNKLIDEILEVL